MVKSSVGVCIFGWRVSGGCGVSDGVSDRMMMGADQSLKRFFLRSKELID